MGTHPCSICAPITTLLHPNAVSVDFSIPASSSVRISQTIAENDVSLSGSNHAPGNDGAIHEVHAPSSHKFTLTSRTTLQECCACGSTCRDRIFSHPYLQLPCCGVCFSLLQLIPFEVGPDGLHSECTVCGLGGKLLCCNRCPRGFCSHCITRCWKNEEFCDRMGWNGAVSLSLRYCECMQQRE